MHNEWHYNENKNNKPVYCAIHITQYYLRSVSCFSYKNPRDKSMTRLHSQKILFFSRFTFQQTDFLVLHSESLLLLLF